MIIPEFNNVWIDMDKYLLEETDFKVDTYMIDNNIEDELQVCY